MIQINEQDFATLCICAVRYCQGRQTYMPSLVTGIVKPFLPKLSDVNLHVMLNDCDFQERYSLYGSETIDKPMWLEWRDALKEESERRVAAAGDLIEKLKGMERVK